MLLNKDYWKEVIQTIENAAHQRTLRELIKDYDLSVTLPEDLRGRVKKIMPYEYEEYDRLVYIEDSDVNKPQQYGTETSIAEETIEAEQQQKETTADESTYTEIERSDNDAALQVDFKPNIYVQRSASPKKPFNWTCGYICQPRRQRVKWSSKIYNLEKSLAEKTLDEQAEELMDASAERFTAWLNSLGSSHESDITKAQLKALFSIEDKRTAEPIEQKDIAKTFVDGMAVELKANNNKKQMKNQQPNKVITVAFGRTLPLKDRPCLSLAHDQPIKPIFPDELLTCEKLFKGIGHLRSVKALIEFYRQRPHLTKPAYLVKSGLFKMKEETTAKQEIPLYELLKLEY